MVKYIFCLLILIQVNWILAKNNQSKIVETTYGQLQGFGFTLNDGSVAEIYLGIPFAQPPTDKNRFEVSHPNVVTNID